MLLTSSTSIFRKVKIMKISRDIYYELEGQLSTKELEELKYDIGFFIIHYGFNYDMTNVLDFYYANKEQHKPYYNFAVFDILQSLYRERVQKK